MGVEKGHKEEVNRTDAITYLFAVWIARNNLTVQ